MNTINTVTRFLQAWEDQDYDSMKELSSVFDQSRAESKQVENFKVVSITGNNAKTTINGESITLEVIPKPGPFQTPKPYGVVFEGKKISTDMTAKEAISHIKSADDIEGFVPEDEKRKTVIKALDNDG